MAEGHVPSPLTIKGMRSSMVKIRHPFFLFSFLAILIGWRKRQSIALPFTTVDTLVFMASRCHFKQRMSGYLKARWSPLFVVLCNIISTLRHSESLTTAWVPWTVSLLLRCPTPQRFYVSRAISFSWLSYSYAIILHPALAVLLSTFCHSIVGPE